MNERISAYLNSLDLSNIVMDRVMKIHDFFTVAIREEIDEIFVNDFVNQDGITQFDTLYCFSKNYFMQSKSFIQADAYEIISYKALITNISIEKQNYDFVDTNDRSRLSITIHISGYSRDYQFKASKMNCNSLRDLHFKVFLPNFFDVTADYTTTSAK